MEHAATLDLEDFEDSELQDRLDRARRQTMGRTALMSQLFGQAQDVVTIASFAAGLVAYAPWLIALLVLALVPAFLGEAHFNAQSYSLNYAWTPGAAGAGLRPPDGGQRRDGEGSEDLRPQRVPHRALPRAVRGLLRRQPASGRPPRRMGRAAHRHRDRRLLRGLRVHRVAHAARRLHDRRPDVPVRIVPPAAEPARGAAHRLLAGGGPGPLPRRPLLVLRDPARDRLAPGPAAGAGAHPGRVHVRGRGLPLPGGGALGGAPPDLHAARGRGARARGRKRRRQDDAGQAARAPLRPGRGPDPPRRPRPAASTTWPRCARTSGSSSRTSCATT